MTLKPLFNEVKAKMKTAFITGSSRGIGRAIALRLASDGFKVILHGASESNHIKNLKYEIEKKIGELITDASSYSFYMQFADGSTVQTSAYNASPDNYMTVLNELGKEFETLFAEDE